jgi:signal transduction histidine kinase
MIYNKKIIYTLLITIFFLMCINIFYYRYCIIKEILIKEYNINHLHIAELCFEENPNCQILMKEYSIEGLSYHNKYGKVIKEIGDVKKYSINIYNPSDIDIFPGIALEPIDNINFFALIKSNFLHIIDSYLIDEYISYGSAKKIIISAKFPEYQSRALIDVTVSWQNINNATKKIFLISMSIFSFFVTVMFYNAYYVGYIVHDLRESKIKAETENSEKTEFLSNVSHELRTPLNSIIGFSEIIMYKSYGTLNPQYQNYIENIHSSGKHLLSIINDLLDLQKASASKLNVDMMDVDLNKIASASLNFLRPRADCNNIKLEIIKPTEHTIIKADPKRLKQVFLNLLSNSVKFTDEGGSVFLKIIPDYLNKQVIIEIIDTGIGISKEDIPRVLAGFYQIDGRLSKKYEGTGIGLPLTLKLVEIMDGKMSIDSELGRGTTVTLEFSMNTNFGMEI